MTASHFQDNDARLHRVAVDLIPPTGLRVERAVALAEDLVASGFSGAATVGVACLSRSALASDAEPLVRAMLAEHGIEVPIPKDENDEYQALLIAFGYWGLEIQFFEGPFYVQIPAWDDQGPLDRALVTLSDRRDNLANPGERSAVEQDMRAIVRAHVPRP